MQTGSSPFKPPHGLQSHEEIVWVRQNDWSKRGGPVAGIFTLLFGLLWLGLGIFSLVIPTIGIGLVLTISGLVVFYKTVTRGGTKYYLTNFRLVETNKGKIVKQIPRSIFKGRTISQFLQISEVPMFKSNVEMFTVKVLDPQSGSVLMNLGTNQGPSVKVLESIQESFYCQYCGRKNDPSGAVCSNCGANL